MKSTLAMAVLIASSYVSPAFAACEAQVQTMAKYFVLTQLNDNSVGKPTLISLSEEQEGQGDVRNGVFYVKYRYHKKNITSVHDLAEVELNVLVHAPTCTTLETFIVPTR